MAGKKISSQKIYNYLAELGLADMAKDKVTTKSRSAKD